MSYAEDAFWDKYESYVNEMFQRHYISASRLLGPRRFTGVLDLGCGRIGEAARLMEQWNKQQYDIPRPTRLSIDLDAKSDALLIGDYRELLNLVGQRDKFNSFISLFSSECTGTQHDNSKLYDSIFFNFPCIQFGLVSGFYYRGKENLPTVAEAGGIVSYQSIEPIEARSALFREERLTLEAPSHMFGQDVVEVWKLLVRR